MFLVEKEGEDEDEDEEYVGVKGVLGLLIGFFVRFSGLNLGDLDEEKEEEEEDNIVREDVYY